MTRVEFLAVKIAGFLGIAVLLCCAAPTKSKVGGMGGGDQQPAVGFNPSVHCPDATLADLDKINPNVIPGLAMHRRKKTERTLPPGYNTGLITTPG